MKRIIVACDGTNQSASRGDMTVSTNVNRFTHAMLNDSKKAGVEQIVFYQSGIGTADLGVTVLNTGKLVQGAIGEGIEHNIADGYNFVMNNYLPGDELFIFGFSRGAFTARVLANLIARLGIFSKPYSWAFKPAFKAYVEGPEKFAEYLEQLAVNVERDQKWWKPEKGEYVPRVYKATIKVVGCWDTVASLGIPWSPLSNAGGTSGDYKYYDGSLVGGTALTYLHPSRLWPDIVLPGIEHAFHALALDECRGPFTPTMWYLPDNEEVAKTIDLRQCWFPGVHTNVGGGYPDQALANLTLAWMVDLCRPFLDIDGRYVDMCVKLDHMPWQIRSKHREAHPDGFDRAYQGWARGRQYDSYKKGQTWTWKYRAPGAYGKPVGRTRETVHASVRERWETKPAGKEWRPPALTGFEPRQRADGRWEWVKDAGGGKQTVIEEESFETKPEGSFEWLLRHASVTPEPQKADDKPASESGSSCIVM
ncbi:uncharacterized protein C8Q71DRAFT_708144 [Rhodofomes roseus]|uniref:T6SS Phospholipase effector Tle1-like catalytic domain-containing protein n=1 Tax=Rhodofomes roseus TaxID=34475 RepID=A0ABQ8KG90_9APHY|nr:uncharacterized protein C8Q71DRAFT_708144 [Rhodofomes roseus]KAH9836798.1 hypothetical protein C8Q71DRAFT_708144 [Rhodofomes roseus]